MDRESYRQGFQDGFAFAKGFSADGSATIEAFEQFQQRKASVKGTRRQSKKQRLLTEMTNKKWAQYKKGSGKKTYVQIRAMVSRSQEYKRKAKKL